MSMLGRMVQFVLLISAGCLFGRLSERKRPRAGNAEQPYFGSRTAL